MNDVTVLVESQTTLPEDRFVIVDEGGYPVVGCRECAWTLDLDEGNDLNTIVRLSWAHWQNGCPDDKGRE